VNYGLFLQQWKDAIKSSKADRELANALAFQVRPGIKEIGANMAKRPMAGITAYREGSKSEYRLDIPLHSYATGEAVSRQEIEKALNRRILTLIDSD
jgi:hypothetical protein